MTGMIWHCSTCRLWWQWGQVVEVSRHSHRHVLHRTADCQHSVAIDSWLRVGNLWKTKHLKMSIRDRWLRFHWACCWSSERMTVVTASTLSSLSWSVCNFSSSAGVLEFSHCSFLVDIWLSSTAGLFRRLAINGGSSMSESESERSTIVSAALDEGPAFTLWNSSSVTALIIFHVHENLDPMWLRKSLCCFNQQYPCASYVLHASLCLYRSPTEI